MNPSASSEGLLTFGYCGAGGIIVPCFPLRSTVTVCCLPRGMRTGWESIMAIPLSEVSDDQQKVCALVSRKPERTLLVRNSLPQLIAIQPHQPDSQIPDITVIILHCACQTRTPSGRGAGQREARRYEIPQVGRPSALAGCN